jgi:hypothetical protein
MGRIGVELSDELERKLRLKTIERLRSRRSLKSRRRG